MKKLALTFIAAIATLVLASPLYAAGEKKSMDAEQQTGMTQDQPMDSGQQMGVSQSRTPEELRGMEVVSQTGEKLGEIQEVTVDDESGEIRFVTISKGGILGMGGEKIPAPLEAFSFENEQAILTVDASKLETAPQQGDLTADQFQRDLQSHYGVSPEWQQDSQQMDHTESMDQGMQDQDMQSPGMQEDSSGKPKY